MQQIRAFIAIELSPQIKAGLVVLQGRLRPGYDRFVKWVDPDHIHLTLKFLGNIPSQSIAEITTSVAEVAKVIAPFRLEIGGLGVFPNFQRPRVAWIGVGGDLEPLLKLEQGIEKALSLLGFPRERRAFSPHLTLGRVRDDAPTRERQQLGELIRSLRVEAFPPLEVASVSLMRSTLTPAGAIYSCLASIRLGMPCQ